MPTRGGKTKVHPLHIPDLLDLICDLLETNDWLNLMRTCGSIFPTIASRIWREVEAQVIMDLVSEPLELRGNEPDCLKAVVNSTVNFARFDIYAPFVRQLRVHGRTARYFKGERRRICTQRAQQGMLLPNVTSLTLLTSDLYPNSEALFWLDLFLIPSLQELSVKPVARNFTAWVSYQAAADILGKLITTCSAIERLEFYPVDIARADSDSGADNLTNRLWTPRLHDLGSYTHLRRITSSIYILSEGGLVALGTLPRLQFLSIHGCDEQLEALQLSVSDDSFPSLTQLNLLGVDATSLSAIMGVKQLTRGLMSLRISQAFAYHERGERWLTHTLPRLLEYTPRLKSFSYATQPSLYHNQNYVHTIEPSSLLQVMSSTPLQQVSLSGIWFGGEDFLTKLATAFPLVTVLRMPGQLISSANLPWFAKIPNLRHLALGGISFAEPFSKWPRSESPLQTLECVADQEMYGDPPYIADKASE
ncbi:hypothetical protein FRC10_011475 [Ceratobasidium sp. 414]|nr:hypothetical protein FRC10_011475 [Ceratobasidium sp. 414]